MKHILSLKTALAICLACAGLTSVQAQTAAPYPVPRVTLVTHFSPGGGTDVFLRELAKYMAPIMKTNFAVENIRGGSGAKALAHVAKGPTDGSMFYGTTPTYIQTTLLSKPSVGYDGLDPMLIVFIDPEVIFTRADSPFKSLQDVMAHAKANPGKLSYASGGIGGSHHLSGALLEHAAGVDMIHAPYKSGSAGATDLMGGQVNMMFEQMYSAMPAIKGGRLRALAITSKTRSPLLPDLPTMAEQGFPEVEVQNWQGLVGPKGMPADLVKLLNAAMNKALQDPEVKDKILSQGNEMGGGTPEIFAALIKAEAPRWGKVVRDAKIDPE